MQSFIRWKKSMSVNIREIDEQHKIMISLINQLYDTLKDNGDFENIKKIVIELQKYKNKHFEIEEALLQRYGYPELKAHQAMHEKMRKNLKEFQVALDKGDMLPLVKLLPFLVDYLHDHLIAEDGKYAAFLQHYHKESISKE